jgi:predicted ATPase
VQRSRSAPEAVFITGSAGIGKTALILELPKRGMRAFFCRGKFEQTGPIAPLSGWVAVLRDLANAILTRSTPELDAWRQKIVGSLGELASLIATVVPEWKAILRVSERPVDGALDTSLNRLAIAIHRLIACFATEAAPVVVMFDDVQWADASSLRILELVLTAPESVNLLTVIAARTAEQPGVEVSMLAALRKSLSQSGSFPETLPLDVWTRSDLRGFLEESFEGRLRDLDGFTELVLTKTDGNPFFAREVIAELVRRDALAFDTTTRRWHWDRRASHALPVADNVLALLAAKIRSLPQAVSHALTIAACLGPEAGLEPRATTGVPASEFDYRRSHRARGNQRVTTMRGRHSATAMSLPPHPHMRVLPRPPR